jgi:hypothetical protein
MWREKTDAEKLAGKRTRRRFRILAGLAAGTVLLYVVFTSPFWKGRSLWGLVLPMPRLVPDALRKVAMVGLALGLAYWVHRWRANRDRTVVCPKCHRIRINDGQTHCQCGGKFLGLEDMQWVEGGDLPEDQPGWREPTDTKSW